MPVADPLQDAASAAPSPGGATGRRARPIYRVFVSSTWLDLQPERRALMDALNRMEEMRFVGMEFFGNRPDDTHDASIDQVDQCEVFIGIIGHRYGSGITAAEYRRARALNLPCFVYFKREEALRPDLTDNDPALAAKLAAFKVELLRGHTVKEFDRPEELAANATADLHNWVAARWISLEQPVPPAAAPRSPGADADRTNVLRLLERIDQDWVKGVLEASLHHRAWLELGLDWREDAVEHPWDRIVVAANRPIQTLGKADSITGVFDAAQHTLLVLGEPGAGKTTTALELARDLIARARADAVAPPPVVLALSTWRGQHKDLLDWLVAELGLRYQVPKRVARGWLEEGRLVLILDGLDEVVAERRAACVTAINAFVEAHPPPGLAVTCRVAEYEGLAVKLRLRSAICLQPLTPAQIDRYFHAAGPSLEPLRHALREDAGLRELARSPLMLSVMTMAWRDAPEGTTAPFAAAQSPEELRRRLFDAYVQAAMRRRGKASGAYTPEQTVGWLTWLALRMKEHGHTLFAVEQLQPGWLDGAWRQFSYFLGSRLLGAIGLVLPFMAMAGSWKLALTMAGLALLTGSYIGAIDFAIARDGWGGPRRASLRFLLLLVGLVCLGLGWLGLSPGTTEGLGLLYLAMVGLAFCAPIDVRTFDIKPAGSIQWSGRQAMARGAFGLGLITVLVALIGLAVVVTATGERGWARGWIELGGWAYIAGLVVGSLVVALDWRRRRLTKSLENVTMAAAVILLGGQIGGSIAAIKNGDIFWRWEAFLAEMWPVLLLAVFGGFGSTLIDPARPQRSGAWFWLRVPVLAFLTMTGIFFLPGLLGGIFAMLLGTGSSRAPLQFIGMSALVGAGCGLVAFLRFGGFNGAQHFLLRWLFARSGHLPRDPEAFLNHAAQLALLQKVGLGYRFVHALLLQHLASPVPGGSALDGARVAAPVPPANGGMGWWRMLAWLGVGAGFMLLVWLGAAGLAVAGVAEAVLGRATSDRTVDVLPSFLGVLAAAMALTIPVLLLAGRRLGRLSWHWLVGSWLALALVMAWLAWDEPLARRPDNLAEAATNFPEAEKSYAVLVRYTNDYPALRHDLTVPLVREKFKWTGLNFTQRPAQGKIWRDFIVSHRAEIEANWSKLAPVRGWIAELNSFERLADLDADLLEISVVSPQVRIPYVQTTLAIACLQALDGQGDTALATLQSMLEVGVKLEAGARGEAFHFMGRDMQMMAISGAQFVLENVPASPRARAEFAAVVAKGGGLGGIGRLYAVRYAMVAQGAGSFGRAITAWSGGGWEFLRQPLDLLGPVAYNRQAVLNRWGEFYSDLQACGARRDAEGAGRRVQEFLAREGRPRFKNIGASWVPWLAMRRLSLPRVEALQNAYWTAEDRRAALLEKLRAP